MLHNVSVGYSKLVIRSLYIRAWARTNGICIFPLVQPCPLLPSHNVGLMVIQTLLKVFVDVIPTGSTKRNRNYSSSLHITVIAIHPCIPIYYCTIQSIALGPGRVERCACVPMLEHARASYSTTNVLTGAYGENV